MRRLRPARSAAVVAVGLLVTITATAVLAAEGDFDFVDTTDFPTVRLVVTPAPDTPAADVMDLRVYQDGAELAAAVLPLQAAPIEMVLLIDASGSMTGAPIAAAKQAAISFIDALPTGSDVSVVAFGSGVEVVADSTSSRVELVAAIEAIAASGETALYDAVIAAADAVNRTLRTRQFVVVLSDGGDTASTADLEDVTTVLAAVPMGFYAIELAGSEPDPAGLASMAEATGGSVVPASDASALAAAYATIAAAVVSQYAVVFEAVTGGETRIEVAIGSGSGEVRLAADLTFPAMPGTDPGTVVTITPTAERVLSPPVTYVYPGPGRLEGGWALRTGAVLIGITLLILFGYALQPAEGPRTGSLLASPGDDTRGRRRRWKWRRSNRAIGIVAGVADRAVGIKSRRGIEASLDAAGITITAGEYLSLVTVAALAGLGLGILIDSPLLAILLVSGALLLPRTVVARAAAKRRAQFADQLEGTLQLIAGSMRAGYGLVQAVATVAAEAPSPTAEQFGRVVIETRVGRDLTSSLRGVAERMRNDDFAWITDAITIQQEVGGNLAEVLDAVGSTIRDRNQIRRQVHALSAEGRMSAVILIALPFAIAGIISIVNPGYLETLLDSTVGKILIAVGSFLMIVGIIWIRRIVKIVF